LLVVGTSGVPDPSGLSGRNVSHFHVLELLGAGGMGAVYRAEDVRLHRTVALKFMLPGYALDEEATARFLREARSVAMLDHPNICTIHEVGESEEGHLFLAMSYYAGETLRDRLTRGPLAVDQALDVAAQIARGLSGAHAAGIVHRDLKPANVMLTADGTVKILDFGLAKARDQTLTVSGVAMGTVAYMSPEQLIGAPADARSDLWSLGVVLFEMLTGTHPSRDDDAGGTLGRLVTTPQSAIRPGITGSLRELVERMLRRNPDERYQSANDVLADLAALRHMVSRVAPPLAAAPPDTSLPIRNRSAVIGVALLAVIVGALGVVQWRASPSDAIDAGGPARSRTSSLAVLPLRNYSGPDQEYFADGMTDELTSSLSKIEALRLIAHQSMAQFTGSKRPVPEIARLLNVSYVVDGAIRQDANRVRITASLIDATRNASVLDTSFDRDRRDVLSLQREVALAIAQAIQVKLTPQDRTRLEPVRPPNQEALDLYIKGTQARFAGNFTGDFAAATNFLLQSAAKDSSYAPTYASLAFIYAFEQDRERAQSYVEKAIQLGPTVAEAHMVRGLVREFFEWDMVGAESAFRRAIELNPNFPESHHELAMLLMRRKRFDAALEEAQIALLRSPTDLRFLNGVGEVQAYSGRYSDALAVADQVLARDSTFSGGFYIRGIAFEQMGRLRDAETAWTSCLRVSPKGCDFAQAKLGYIYAATGRRHEAQQVLDTLVARVKTSKDGAGSVAFDIATVYTGLGDRAEALTWFERAAEAHTLMLYLGIEPAFRPLHNEPRFQALLKRIGLAT
jgi:serine/threonine-protein kinase